MPKDTITVLYNREIIGDYYEYDVFPDIFFVCHADMPVFNLFNRLAYIVYIHFINSKEKVNIIFILGVAANKNDNLFKHNILESEWEEGDFKHTILIR